MTLSVAARTAIVIAERTHANTTRDDGTEVPRICRFVSTSSPSIPQASALYGE